MRLLTLLAVLLLVDVDDLRAQRSLVYNPDAERVFEIAMRHFVDDEYPQALTYFRSLIKDFPENHRLTAAYIMGAKCHYRMGESEASIEMLREFVRRFSTSTYLPDAQYTLGLNFLRQRRYNDAAKQFIEAWRGTADSTLARRAEALLDRLADSFLTAHELESLMASAPLPQARVLLGVRLAEQQLQGGNPSAAQETLRRVLAAQAHGRYAAEARAVLDRIRRGGVVKLGVIVPLLDGDDSDESPAEQDLLYGSQLAVDEHNERHFVKVNLEVRNSGRDPERAVRHTEELASDSEVVAIVGPVYSDEALASAPVANARRIPMITPTATAVSIGAVGPYVFQANPDYAMRGRAMAFVAARRLQARRFAVLAPDDSVRRVFVQGFIDEVQAFGGEVVDVQWYEAGTTDLRSQLMEMRRRAFELMDLTVVEFSSKMRTRDVTKMVEWGVPQRVVDSLILRESRVPPTVLFGPNGKRVADSLRIPTTRQRIRFDSLAVPVRTIDALFLPITNPDEVSIVSSQVRYFNFHASLLGNEEWNNLDELDRNRQHASGVYFPTDSRVDEQSSEYRRFVQQYRRVYGRAPTLSALFAYDAMRMLLSVIAAGATGRNEIMATLGALPVYSGLRSKISFDANGVNGYLSVLQYTNRIIRHVCDVDVVKRQIYEDASDNE